MTVREISEADQKWIHPLNEAHAIELSHLTPERLAEMVTNASYARCEDGAFLLAFKQSDDYDGTNFLWFKERYEKFIYIDRVCVDDAYQRRGLARKLYENLFQWAVEYSAGPIVCEVNSDPPNPNSDAFHAAQGFVEVGSARLEDRAKTVTYLMRGE
ncbi:MAG: GNAT family N-acetyltransferase [Pikeienuella sp.]